MEKPTEVDTPKPPPTIKEQVDMLVGEASTLFQGKDGVFDTTRAQEITTKLVNLTEDAASAERIAIMTRFLKEQQTMIEKYRILIKHTGSLVVNSMVFAYSKALNDSFKLIAKGATDNVENNEETQKLGQ